MSTSKLKDSEPIKNDSGAVKSKGDLSSLAGVEKVFKEFDQTVAGPNWGATYLADGNFVTLDIANTNNEHYRNQLTDYSSLPLDIDYVTGQPTGYQTNISRFVASTGITENRNDGYWFFVGEPHKYIPVAPIDQYSDPVAEVLSQSYDILFATSETLSIPFVNNKRAISIYGGPVNPNNELHEKTFQVVRYSGGDPVLTTSHTVGAWQKLNMNFDTNYSKVEVSCTNADLGYSVGIGSGFIQATTQTRTATIASGNRVNPLTFNGVTNLTLVSGEKAIRIPCTSATAYQVTIVENDGAGNKSNPIYYIIPSGSTGTYYPIYNQVAIAEGQGRQMSVQVLA